MKPSTSNKIKHLKSNKTIKIKSNKIIKRNSNTSNQVKNKIIKLK